MGELPKGRSGSEMAELEWQLSSSGWKEANDLKHRVIRNRFVHWLTPSGGRKKNVLGTRFQEASGPLSHGSLFFKLHHPRVFINDEQGLPCRLWVCSDSRSAPGHRGSLTSELISDSSFQTQAHTYLRHLVMSGSFPGGQESAIRKVSR